MAEPIIRLEHVTRTYHVGDVDVHALRDVSLTIEAANSSPSWAPPGSGKSTLMAMLGCLDRPTSGRYFFEGVDVAGLDEPELAQVCAASGSASCSRASICWPAPARSRTWRCRCSIRPPGRPAPPRASSGRAPSLDAAGPRRSRAQHARPALRRPAAARRDRARPDQQPGPAARRRADRQSRHPHLARDHGDADAAQPRAGRHHHRRHP